MCAMCKKSFKQPGALKMHLHTHTGGSPFSCGFLWEIFQRFCAQKVHLYTLWQFIFDVCKNTLMKSGALNV